MSCRAEYVWVPVGDLYRLRGRAGGNLPRRDPEEDLRQHVIDFVDGLIGRDGEMCRADDRPLTPAEIAEMRDAAHRGRRA